MANSEQIDGTTLLLVLAAAREILPTNIYEQALRKSKLEEFRVELPLATNEKIADTSQITAFWRAIYEQVNFSTFKLMQRNLGGQMAQDSQARTTATALRASILALPRDERLAITVQAVSNSVNKNGAHTTYQPYQQGFLLYFDNCPFICHEVKSQEPLCHLYEYMFLKILKGYTKLPLVSREIECIATGGAACRYYFHEVDPTSKA